jgi:hypothetical protein
MGDRIWSGEITASSPHRRTGAQQPVALDQFITKNRLEEVESSFSGGEMAATKRRTWSFQTISLVLAMLVGLVGWAIRRGQPDSSHIPEFLRPHRPAGIALINGLGSVLIEHGLLNLSPTEKLLQSGCKAARLPPNAECVLDHMDDGPDYNPMRWREGLQVLKDSLENESNLTTLGVIIVNEILKRFVTNRARLIHQWKLLGGTSVLEAQVIDKPIIILGLPRTGSTFLHNLLSQDPTLRAPLHWEYIEPVPEHGQSNWEDHIANSQANLDMFYRLTPGMYNMHPIDADMGEECIVVLGAEYTSVMFQAALHIPSYWAWLAALESHRHALRWQHRTLQYLQFRAMQTEHVEDHQMFVVANPNITSKPAVIPPTARNPAKQWVLKAPWFMWMLDEIVSEYPDARIVWTHRAPSSTIASLASLYTKNLGAFSDDLDLSRIGRNELAIGEEWLYRGMKFRDEWHERDPTSHERILDVHLDDLQRNPIQVMERLYPTLLGRELPALARRRMQEFLDSQKFQHGHHKANLADFGLSRDLVMERPIFRDYCARYNVTKC